MNASSGCGGSACRCSGGGKDVVVSSINGIALHQPGVRPDAPDLRERAWGELLRQEAVRQGLLPRHTGLDAPVLLAQDQCVIETMLERAVNVPTPTAEECRRHYEAQPMQFMHGRQVHVRHILFALTPGVDDHELAVRAEQALIELSRAGVAADRFAHLARELSDCPSGAAGGDLGWLGPDDCADELANELFHQKNPLRGMGLHPRLVHSRQGFHIVEVLGRKQGRQLPFEAVHARIAAQLAQQARAKALHQYKQLLAGRARVEGVVLDGADTLLVQ